MNAMQAPAPNEIPSRRSSMLAWATRARALTFSTVIHAFLVLMLGGAVLFQLAVRGPRVRVHGLPRQIPGRRLVWHRGDRRGADREGQPAQPPLRHHQALEPQPPCRAAGPAPRPFERRNLRQEAAFHLV